MLASLDHVAFAVRDAEGLIAFYRALGLGILFIDDDGFALASEREWRDRRLRIFGVQVGETKVFMIPWEIWRERGYTPAALRAPEARPGTADLCFVWEGGLQEAHALLERAGADVIAGPVEREGGAGGGRRRGTSLYFRDPDENLLELIVYEPPEEADSPSITSA